MRSLSLEKSSNIKLIILENQRFVIKHYEISFSMVTRGSTDEKEMEELQLEQNISFAKVMCFLDAILNDSIVITTDSLPYYQSALCDFSNNYILIPDTSDNTLISVIMSKLNAIVGSNTEVNTVTLFDIEDQLKYKLEIYDEDDDAELINIKQWLGDLAFNDVSWWMRNDQSTWDGVAISQDEYDAVKSRLDDDDSESMFDEIENTVRAIFESVQPKPQKEAAAELIEVDFQEETKKKKWKPKLV